MHPDMKILRMAVTFCVLLLALTSCKKKEEAPAPAPANRTAPAQDTGAGTPKAESVPQDKKRKVILNHTMNLEVKDFSVALDALTKLAESSGGYVFKSSRNSHDVNSSYGQVSIRVPTSKAGSVLTSIRRLGRIDSENSSAEDITEVYVDLEARLKNARSSETRLVELYRKAGELSDVLEVEKELTRVRGDIEAFEAKKKNMDLLTEMVTIEIYMNEKSGFPSLERIWTPISTAFGKSVEILADSIHTLIVFIGAIIPWLAVIGPLVYVYIRRQRKKQQEKESSAIKDTRRYRDTDSDSLP